MHSSKAEHTNTVNTSQYKDVTGYGFFTEGGVPYSCTGHQVPYFAAVKDPYPINGLLYALGIFLI